MRGCTYMYVAYHISGPSYGALYVVLKNYKFFRLERDAKEEEGWKVTHVGNLRESEGGIPLGFCVIRYDSIGGRLVLADNYTIRAIYF